MKKLFTIGYSGFSLEDFASTLKIYEVDTVADVRSYPYSKFKKDFNQDKIKFFLKNHSIKYVFLGEELGARPKDESCYENGTALYEKIVETDFFEGGIRRLINGLENYNIALMCAEKDPLTCHRTILICHFLRKYSIEIAHILPNTHLETHSQLEERLLNKHHLQPATETQQLGLPFLKSKINIFGEDVLEIAYRRQAQEIQYSIKSK